MEKREVFLETQAFGQPKEVIFGIYESKSDQDAISQAVKDKKNASRKEDEHGLKARKV